MVMKRLTSNSDKGDCGRDTLSNTYFKGKIKPAGERDHEGYWYLKVDLDND